MALLSGDQSKSFLAELIKINKNNLVACGFEKLTVAGTVVKFLNIPTNATYALIEVESSIATAAIRYLELGDKTPPSTTDGIARSNTAAFDVSGYQNIVNFRAIQVGAGTHTLQIQYYK